MTDHREKARDSKTIRILIAVAAAVFLAAAAASVMILRPPASRVAEIVQDDTVLYTIDLDAADDMVFTIYYPRDGLEGARSSNTITIQDGEIWVSGAECPDHTCMKMGRLRSKNLPIVCLPNHLVIRFLD